MEIQKLDENDKDLVPTPADPGLTGNQPDIEIHAVEVLDSKKKRKKEGKRKTLNAIEDPGLKQPSDRPPKDPGYSFIEALWNKSIMKDGKVTTYSAREMMMRGYAWGRHVEQALRYKLNNRVQKESPKYVLDLSRKNELMELSKEARENNKGETKLLTHGVNQELTMSYHGHPMKLLSPPEGYVVAEKSAAADKNSDEKASKFSMELPAPQPAKKREVPTLDDVTRTSEASAKAKAAAARKLAADRAKEASDRQKKNFVEKKSDQR